MRKFHIHPVTGNPGICNATQKCPFGDESEHYSTEEEARRAFESKQNGSFNDKEKASLRLQELIDNGASSKLEYSKEMRDLWKKVTGLPFSPSGDLYLGVDKAWLDYDKDGNIVTKYHSTHLLCIYRDGDRWGVDTTVLNKDGGLDGGRNMKRLSRNNLNFDEAVKLAKEVKEKLGLAEKTQKEWNESVFKE